MSYWKKNRAKWFGFTSITVGVVGMIAVACLYVVAGKAINQPPDPTQSPDYYAAQTKLVKALLWEMIPAFCLSTLANGMVMVKQARSERENSGSK